MRDAFDVELTEGDAVIFNLSGWLARGVVKQTGTRQTISPDDSQWRKEWGSPYERYYARRRGEKPPKLPEEYVVIEHANGTTTTANRRIVAKVA